MGAFGGISKVLFLNLGCSYTIICIVIFLYLNYNKAFLKNLVTI